MSLPHPAEPRLSVSGRRWRLAPPDPERALAFARELALPPAAARVLSARGFDLASGEAWLGAREEDLVHDPFRLAGLAEAAGRTARAIWEDERIRVFGDYDADGVTATAILVENLARLGAEVDGRLPDRAHGYGIQPADVEAAQRDGIGLVIAVDNGITSFSAARRARELGVDLVVLDHHQPGPELPPALAVVDPKRPGEPYPYPHLSGAGLALKLVQALTGFEPDAPWRDSLDLAAIGTVADVVPLTGENRWIVRAGLRRMNEAGARRPGVAALLEVAGSAGRPVREHELGFLLAPRLNAAGRMQDPSPAFECLLARDPARARELARILDHANRDRRRVEREIFEAASRRAEEEARRARVIVLGDPGWHPGVVGIVAGRLARRFHRPVLLAAGDGGRWRGSGRSIPAFDLHEALSALSHHFATFGGHRQAAGFTLAGEAGTEGEALRRLQADLDAYAAARLTDEDLVPELVVDARAELSDFTPALGEFLDAFGPYGAEHPRPRFLVAGLSAEARKVGRDGAHAAVVCLDRRGFRAEGIAFGLGPVLAGRGPGGRWDVVAWPEWEDWQGARRLRLRVDDLREASGVDVGASGEAPRRGPLAQVRGAELAALAAEAERLAPDREALVGAFLALRDLARREGPLLAADAPLRAAEAARLPRETVHQALRVFTELGLAHPMRRGGQDVWVWTPPEGERLDLATSPTFALGQAVRDAVATLGELASASEDEWRRGLAAVRGELLRLAAGGGGPAAPARPAGEPA